MNLSKVLSLVAMAASVSGCFQPIGLIYTEVTTPLDVNLDRTPVYKDRREGDVKRIHWSWIDIRWDTNAIADIAKKYGGIEEVYYADRRCVSVFFGLWQQDYIEIYGKPAPLPAEPASK
jgi:hypothetical protein